MILSISSPSERQKEFLLERHKYIAFGGARGGGKSWAVRTTAKLLALLYPGIKICIVRKTYPELKSNHVDVLLFETKGVATYRSGDREFLFKNGSVIKLRSCRTDAELTKFQGTEYDVVFIDEATQFTEEAFRMISATVRGANRFPKRVYLTCNPGGVGHSWVKRLFIDRRFNKGEDPDDYAFIKSRVFDNPALLKFDPDYAKRLEALPPKLRRAWLEGDWDIFEGQFFEEFRDVPEHYGDRLFTHVIDPFEIPREWEIYRSYDFGYGKPFDVSWWAVDYDGRAYLILQLYGASSPNVGLKWTPERQFEEIAAIERSHRWLKGKSIHGVADPSIWDASRGEAIVDTADRHFISFEPGDNKRIPGWMQCHYRLAFDETGRPMVYFFKTCREAIRTLPSLVYSKTNPEDLDTEGEDHFADSFRYFAMSRPIAPRRAEAKRDAVLSDPLELGIKYVKYGF